MTITISPARKFAFMTGLVIVFLAVLHFGVVPNLHLLSDLQFPQEIRIALIVVVIVITFSVIIFTNMFRRFVPGPATWKQEKYWTTLTIEMSLVGIGKLIYWFAKIFTFSVVLYAVLSHTIHLYLQNVPAIMDGTYVYENIGKMEVAFMGAPLVMVFLLILYLCVKLYDRVTIEKDVNTDT